MLHGGGEINMISTVTKNYYFHLSLVQTPTNLIFLGKSAFKHWQVPRKYKTEYQNMYAVNLKKCPWTFNFFCPWNPKCDHEIVHKSAR